MATSYLSLTDTLVRQVNMVFFQGAACWHCGTPLLRIDHGGKVGMEYRAQDAVDFFGAVAAPALSDQLTDLAFDLAQAIPAAGRGWIYCYKIIFLAFADGHAIVLVHQEHTGTQ